MKIFKIVAYMFGLIYIQNLAAWSHGIDSWYPEDVYVKILYKAHPDSDWIYVPANAKGKDLGTSGGICPYGLEVVTAKNRKAGNFTLLGSLSLRIHNFDSASINTFDRIFKRHHKLKHDISWLCSNSNWVISSQGEVGLWWDSEIIVQSK